MRTLLTVPQERMSRRKSPSGTELPAAFGKARKVKKSDAYKEGMVE